MQPGDRKRGSLVVNDLCYAKDLSLFQIMKEKNNGLGSPAQPQVLIRTLLLTPEGAVPLFGAEPTGTEHLGVFSLYYLTPCHFMFLRFISA